MPNSLSRQEILNRIETSRKRRSSFAYASSIKAEEIYKPIFPDAVSCFKNELEAINGQCFLCESEVHLYARLKAYLEDKRISSLYCRDSYIAEQLGKSGIPFSVSEADFTDMEAGVTGCEFLIARTGSVLVSSASPSGRQMHVFPPVHIVIAHASQLVNYPDEALAEMTLKYGDKLPSAITTITGPSRTADIEKTLVLGAHGPKEFIVFLSTI